MDYDKLREARRCLADRYARAPSYRVNGRRTDTLLYWHKYQTLRTALQRRDV